MAHLQDWEMYHLKKCAKLKLTTISNEDWNFIVNYYISTNSVITWFELWTQIQHLSLKIGIIVNRKIKTVTTHCIEKNNELNIDILCVALKLLGVMTSSLFDSLL